MKSETKPNLIGSASFYFGLSAISLWIVISLFHILKDDAFFVVMFLSAVSLHFAGFILGIIGIIRKNVKKKLAIIGLIINSPVVLFAIILFAVLQLGYSPSYVPDKQEITERFPEFIVNPSNIQGINMTKRGGNALFKYYTSSDNFFEQLKHQVSENNWIIKSSDDSIIEFIKENHTRRDGEIVLYLYLQARVFYNKETGLVCVGVNKFVDLIDIKDFKNHVDSKAAEITLWPQFDCCVSGDI